MSSGGFWGPYYSPEDDFEWTTRPPTTVMPVEIEQNSGFHILEIHAPSAGISFFAIVCGLIAVALAYGCYKRCCYARLFGPAPTQFSVPPPPPPPPPPTAPAPAPASVMEPLLQLMALQGAMGPQRMIADQRFPPGRITAYEDQPQVVVHPPTASARFVKPPRPTVPSMPPRVPSPVISVDL